MRRMTGLPETVVTLAVGIVMLVVTDHSLHIGHYLFIAAMVLAVALMSRWPVLGAALTLPLLPVVTYFFGGSGALSMMVVAVVIEFVVSRGLMAAGAVLALVHVALSCVDLSEQSLFLDPLGLLLVALLLTIAYAFGYNRYAQRRRRRELQQSLVESQRRQRLAVARDLHDSVATSLTSVVMRSQALELSVPGDSEEADRLRTELTGISETSRTALEQLRAMLRVLNTELPGESSESAEPPTVRAALRDTVNELRAHGLKVDTAVDLPAGNRLPVDRDAVARILVEMTSNAVKHSPPRSTVTLDCRVGTTADGSRFLLSMTNGIGKGVLSDDGDTALFSTHIGLASIQSRAADAGGSIEMGRVPGNTPLWRTALSLPIVE